MSEHEPYSPNSCMGLTSNCRNPECDWRGKSNDGPSECPKCGEDRRCRKDRIPAYSFCELHGGPNPGRNYYGPGPPAKSPGGYSKFPIVNLATKYAEMVRHPVLMSLRGSLTILRNRLYELLDRIDSNYTPDRMKKLTDLWRQFKLSFPINYVGSEEGKKAYRQLDEEMEAVYHDYKSWDQIIRLMNVETKMVKEEVTIIEKIKAIVTVEDMYEHDAQLMGAIQRALEHGLQEGYITNVTKLLKQIQYEFARIVGDDHVVESTRAGRSPEKTRYSNVVDGELLDT